MRAPLFPISFICEGGCWDSPFPKQKMDNINCDVYYFISETIKRLSANDQCQLQKRKGEF